MGQLCRSGFTSAHGSLCLCQNHAAARRRASGHEVSTSPADGLRHHNGKTGDSGTGQVVVPAAGLPAPGWATGGSDSPCAGG